MEQLSRFWELKPGGYLLLPPLYAAFVSSVCEVDLEGQLHGWLAELHALDEEPEIMLCHTSLGHGRGETGNEFIQGDVVQGGLDLLCPEEIDYLNDVTSQSLPHCRKSPSAR